MVCRLRSSAEDRFLLFLPLPGISCPEQPRYFWARLLTVWMHGAGGSMLSAADLTKTPLPKAEWGPKGNREKWAETASRGLGLQSFMGLGEPWGQKGF